MGYPHNDYLTPEVMKEMDEWNQSALIPTYRGIPLADDEIEYENAYIPDERYTDENDEEMGIDPGTYLTQQIPFINEGDRKYVEFIINFDPSRVKELNKRAYDVIRRVISSYKTPMGGYGSVDWAHQDFAPGGFSVWVPIGYSIWDIQAHYQNELKKAGMTLHGWNQYTEIYIKREIVTGVAGPAFDMLSSIPFIGWIISNAVELAGETFDYIKIPVYENIAFYGTMSEELITNNWGKIMGDLRKCIEIDDQNIHVPPEQTSQALYQQHQFTPVTPGGTHKINKFENYDDYEEDDDYDYEPYWGDYS